MKWTSQINKNQEVTNSVAIQWKGHSLYPLSMQELRYAMTYVESDGPKLLTGCGCERRTYLCGISGREAI